MVKIPIYARSIKYYYLYWKKADDEAINSVLSSKTEINVWFMKSYLGKKKISKKFKRIFLTKYSVELIPDNAKYFILKKNNKGELVITCE